LAPPTTLEKYIRETVEDAVPYRDAAQKEPQKQKGYDIMKLPISWLSDFTDISNIDLKAYEHGMTMSGSKIEGIESLGDEISNVVTGKILKITQHPDAEKLVVCSVDVGEAEPIQIVTGAINVFEGAIIPVAKHKSTLPGGVKITKGKLRGVESFGMLCSVEELAIGSDADGIMILPDDTAVGADICEVLGLNESIVEFEITSNRPDCLSVIGIARETAATFGRELTIPAVNVPDVGGSAADLAQIEIADFDLCPRFCARIVKNVKMGESPLWMQKRLEAAGIRAISNIVDITNYVMLEYGQPMHAYDFDKISGGKIIVRALSDGEILETLDGQERKLDSSMIGITDESGVIGVAGVMGGASTEISDSTTTILFESANFNPASVRSGAKKLQMRTEASGRFEKGLDRENSLAAINRACQLIAEIGAGEVVSGVIDVAAPVKSPTVLPLEVDRINKFLGCDISEAEMVKILEKLEFSVADGKITVPSFRADVTLMEDIAEEVARIWGYDKIPSTTALGDTICGGRTVEQETSAKIKSNLTAQGLCEIVTYSFISPKNFDLLNLPQDSEFRDTVNILNPLGEETSVMRTLMLDSLLAAMARNYNRRNPSALLFEVGNVYRKNNPQSPVATAPLTKEPKGKLPIEPRMLSVGMYGEYVDFYVLKGVLENLFDMLGLKVSYNSIGDMVSYHPGQTAEILVGNRRIGVVGQVHPAVAKNFEIDSKAFAAEINLESVFQYCKPHKQYKALPKFPAMSRDVAMLIADEVPVSEIEAIFTKNRGNILESFSLFDVYKGEQIESGKKSVAYSLTFRAADRTLTDDEVSAVMAKILDDLKNKLNADLRG